MSNKSKVDELALLVSFGRIRRQLNLKATQALKPFGLGPKQALVLREVRILTQASPMELARLTYTDPASTGKILESLVKKQWLKRTNHPEDRRCYHVMLTAKGLKTIQKVETAYRKLAKEFCEPLDENQKNVFYKMFIEISNHLEKVSNL